MNRRGKDLSKMRGAPIEFRSRGLDRILLGGPVMIRISSVALRACQLVCALSPFVWTLAAGAATVYKWTDKRGEVHYSDKRPAGSDWEIVHDSNISVIPSVVPTAPPLSPSPSTETARDDGQLAFERALAERRQRLLDQCEQDRGVDCATQVDTELQAERIQATGQVIHLAPRPPATAH